jgi:hypothetical protein
VQDGASIPPRDEKEEEKRHEKEDEKRHEKEDEKRDEKRWEDKWHQDLLTSLTWAFLLIWAGVVFLAESLSWFSWGGKPVASCFLGSQRHHSFFLCPETRLAAIPSAVDGKLASRPPPDWHRLLDPIRRSLVLAFHLDCYRPRPSHADGLSTSIGRFRSQKRKSGIGLPGKGRFLRPVPGLL